MSEVETGALGPGRIEPRELEQEMRSSFLDYAMSVIVSRALPDVRDGLKPVHRRVLYGMHEAGLQPNRPYKKSATTVGSYAGRSPSRCATHSSTDRATSARSTMTHQRP
jgi:DNA gyrase/topoisomerase IV subunit A